jgi:hypothetical protein
MIGAVKLNIARPSANAPQSIALYDKLRQMADGSNETDSDQAVLTEIVSGLFTIVAGLEAESRSE